VGLGIWAQRSIRRFPDMLTGQKLANAGIGLGLIFGVASGTVTTVQYFVRSKQAAIYAKKYAEVLQSADLGSILWYNAQPELRKDKTGADMIKELDSKPKEKQMMAMSMGPLGQALALRERIASSKEVTVRFVRIEAVGDDEGRGTELQIYALALFEITGPGTKKFPEKQQYSLGVLKARPKGRIYEWWTESVVFPYVPRSYVSPAAPVGDGHDHAGGGH